MLGVIVFAHGSRDPLWRAPVEAVARRIGERAPGTRVGTAGATRLHVLPMFLGMGKHAREDLPQLMDALRHEHPAVAFEQLPTAGEDPRLIDLLATLALKDAP